MLFKLCLCIVFAIFWIYLAVHEANSRSGFAQASMVALYGPYRIMSAVMNYKHANTTAHEISRCANGRAANLAKPRGGGGA